MLLRSFEFNDGVEVCQIGAADARYDAECKANCIMGERRAVGRACRAWREACGNGVLPSLVSLGIGDATEEWWHGFLIRRDHFMAHAVFVACGEVLRAEWDMKHLGNTVENAVPHGLRDRFAESCQRSLAERGPVILAGRYRGESGPPVLFRCFITPVQERSDGVDFIYGTFSCKAASNAAIVPFPSGTVGST